MLYLISDMLSRIRVALKRYCQNVVVLNSRLCKRSLSVMQRLGYINSYKVLNFKHLNIELKYISK